MKIAVFDVCDTLYNVNTTFSFLDNYFSENSKYLFFRKISRLFPVKVLNHFVYKVLKKDIIRSYGTSFLKGKSIREIQRHSKVFVSKDLVSEIKDVTVSMMHKYRDNGYKIVLMSGSYAFIIQEVAAYFSTDSFYASKLNISNGNYTGKYDEDILLDKYELLKKEFEEIDELIVVSDNKSDLTLMQAANKAFAICNKEKDLEFWKPHANITCIKGAPS